LVRYNEAGTVTGIPNAAFLALYCQIRLTVGLAVDFTVRFGRPKIAPSTAMIATSPIITSGSMVERPADAMTIVLPPGTHNLTFTFNDGTTQTINNLSGSYLVPTTLNKPYINGINSVTSGGVLASAGTTTSAFVGASNPADTFASSGSTTSAFASSATAASVLASSGSTTSAFASAALKAAALASAGVSSIAFVGQSSVGANSILNTSGTSTATFASTVTAASVLVSSGSSLNAFAATSAAAGALSSSGSSTVQFGRTVAIASVLSSGGSSTATFASAAAKQAVLASAGSTTIAWTGATVRTVSGTQSLSMGQSATAVLGISRVLQAVQSLSIGQTAKAIAQDIAGPPIWLEGSIGPDDMLTGSIDADMIFGDFGGDPELEGEI